MLKLFTGDGVTGDLPRPAHSATSGAAADAMVDSASSLREKVLMFLLSRGPHGSTDEETQDELCMSGSTQRPRRIELWQAGCVKQANVTRRTRSGHEAEVWVAVPGIAYRRPRSVRHGFMGGAGI